MNKNKIVLTVEILADADFSRTLTESLLKDIYESLTTRVNKAGLSDRMKLTGLSADIIEYDDTKTPGINKQYVN